MRFIICLRLGQR